MQNTNWGLITSFVLVGLIIGAIGGYYVGYDKGWEGAAAQQKITAQQNPFTDIQTNPLQNVKTNPLKNVKTNPFE